MDKNSHAVCFPPFCKSNVQNSATEYESQRAHGTKDSSAKTNPPPNRRFINIYHGQALTLCMFPPFCKNNVHNRTTEKESQRAHGTKDSPAKTNPSTKPQIHKHIPWIRTHELCVSPILQKERPKQCNRTRKSEEMAQRTVLPKQALPTTTVQQKYTMGRNSHT